MKDCYYFPHDSNAKDDPKCSMLIEQLGLEGYGIYWVLVETLRDQPNYRYPMNMLPILARKYNTTSEKIRVVVGNYGLFITTKDEFFLSESLCKRMEKVETIREANRAKGLKSGVVRKLLAQGTISINEPLFNHGSTVVEPQVNKEKKRKENEIKENETLTDLQKTISEFISFRKKIKKPMTDRAIELLINELDRLADTDEGKIDILNQSMLNGWQGVFELKSDKRTVNPFSAFTGG